MYRARVSFEMLLAAMFLLLFVPVMTSAEWVSMTSRALYTLVMLTSLYLVSANRQHLVIGILLFIPVVTTKWMLAPVLEIHTQLLTYCVFQVIFLSYISWLCIIEISIL